MKSATKAGTQVLNHTAPRLLVKSAIKAGSRIQAANHNARRLVVKSATKAGAQALNHTAPRLLVKTATKAGKVPAIIDKPQHNTPRLVVKAAT